MKTIFLDTETIDYTSNVDYDVMCQIAFIYPEETQLKLYYDYCKPEMLNNITIESMETHGLTPDFLENQLPFTETRSYMILNHLSKEPCYLIAHNSEFDLEVIRRAGIDISNFKVIDTLQICRLLNDKQGLLWNSCRLSYLKYYLSLWKEKEKVSSLLLGEKYKTEFINPHNAVSDVIDLFQLWKCLSEKYSISMEQAEEISSMELQLEYMFSGKYNGTRISELNLNDLVWNSENSYDKNIRNSCKIELSKRK